MTELEQKLYNEVQSQEVEFIEHIKSSKSECRYILFPIFIEGCFDSIVKDTETNTYYLKYSYTKKGVNFLGSTMADPKYIELRQLDVTQIFQ